MILLFSVFRECCYSEALILKSRWLILFYWIAKTSITELIRMILEIMSDLVRVELVYDFLSFLVLHQQIQDFSSIKSRVKKVPCLFHRLIRRQVTQQLRKSAHRRHEIILNRSDRSKLLTLSKRDDGRIKHELQVCHDANYINNIEKSVSDVCN